MTANPIPTLVIPAINPSLKKATLGGAAGFSSQAVQPAGQQSTPMQGVGGTVQSTPMQTVPTATVQDPSVSSALQAIQRHASTVSPRMYTVGTPIYAPGGAAPTPPSDSYLSQQGLYSVTFDGGGHGTLTLAQPFPNGWLSLQLSGFYPCQYNSSGVTLQTITLDISGVTSATVKVDVLAVGW